ncbi:MAG: IclR family transcriptional regulator [Clostridium sp.]
MIQSLLRSLELLEFLKEPSHKFTIAELSDKMQLPPSTIHRILQTFCEKKFVIRDEHSHTYQLGPALISLGRAAANNIRIQDAALPILKNLSYVTREDSYLVIQVGDKGLVLDKVDGPNHLKVVEEFGYEMDLHCGAIRKVLLAYQSADYIDFYLNHRLDRPEAFPQISRGALSSELKTIQQNGIAVSHGEYVHDAVGIGAPIFGIDGHVAASVGIIAPYSRIADDMHLTHLEEQVKHSSAELSYYMGHTFLRSTPI